MVLCALIGLGGYGQPHKAMAAAEVAPTLSVDSRLVASGAVPPGRPMLAFTWINKSTHALLLQTHVDSDGGVMYDSIVLEQGVLQASMTSARKASATRYCVLPAGRSHTVRIHDIDQWLGMLGVDPARPWRASYLIGSPAWQPTEAAPVCSTAGHAEGVPLWRGKASGPFMSSPR
jgi:hypothetical protein